MKLTPEDVLAKLKLVTNPFVPRKEQNNAANLIARHIAEGGRFPRCSIKLGRGVLDRLTLFIGGKVTVKPENGEHPISIGPIKR